MNRKSLFIAAALTASVVCAKVQIAAADELSLNHNAPNLLGQPGTRSSEFSGRTMHHDRHHFSHPGDGAGFGNEGRDHFLGKPEHKPGDSDNSFGSGSLTLQRNTGAGNQNNSMTFGDVTGGSSKIIIQENISPQ